MLSELRQDILTGEWVIFAGNRKKRPYDFVKKSVPKTVDSKDCQFCPGNEHFTTNAVYQDGPDGKWKIRVFPNKYPAVSDEYNVVDGENFYNAVNGNGVHEVVVDTPEHRALIHDFSENHIFEILKVLRERFVVISSDENIKYIQMFKNCGPDAGASIMHSHWQIIGVPVIPEKQSEMIKRNAEYKKKSGKCLICGIVEHEIKEKKRIIAESTNFVLFTPYASKMSFECYIAAKKHISSFADFNDEMLIELSKMIKMILSGVKTLRKDICYNLCFEDTPRGEDGHWYMRIIPRMGNLAGFEHGTNSYINPVLPEVAAEYMKDKILENYRG